MVISVCLKSKENEGKNTIFLKKIIKKSFRAQPRYTLFDANFGRTASCETVKSRAEELRDTIGSEAFDVTLAGAKLIGGLQCLNTNQLGIERNSVYAASILLPQMARTLSWPTLLTAVSIRVFGFLYLCILVHGGLLTLITKQEVVVDAFAGQPYLCDFPSACEDTDTCRGPGGTRSTPERVYGYGDWVTRNFVKDSMKAIFPEKSQDIDKSIDPGEYGAETYFGRLLCCFLFMTAVDPELELALNLARLLWYCPSDGAPWLSLRRGHEPKSRETASEWWLNHVVVKVGGMTVRWKIFNAIFVLLPKVVLWVLTCFTGINFLMETSVIDDVIVNACALGFLLNLDNMILDSFASLEVKCLMERCEDMDVTRVGAGTSGKFEEDDILHEFHFGQQIEKNWWSLMCKIIPWKFVRVVLLTVSLVWRYYHSHCTREDGRWVSRPVHMPTSYSFTFFNTFHYLFPVTREAEAAWTMPN